MSEERGPNEVVVERRDGLPWVDIAELHKW